MNIWLSTNGGFFFDIPLATNVPNSGSQTVILPNIRTKAARVKVEAVDNIFFDISNTNFSIIPAQPLISFIADQSVDENTPLVLHFTISDLAVGPSQLLVTASSSDTGLVPSENLVLDGIGTDRTLTVTPAAYRSGSAAITLSLSDGFSTVSNSFVITVLPVNHAPVLAPIPNFTVNPGNLLVFTNSASDLDQPAQHLTFSLGDAPTGAVIDPATGLFSWPPSEAQTGSTNWVTIIVTDDGVGALSSTQSFQLVVVSRSISRLVPPLPEQVVIEGQTLVLTGLSTTLTNGSDQLLFCLCPNAPAGACVNSTNGVFTWTPSEAQGPSTNLISYIVTDPGPPSISVTQTVTIVVLESNSPPDLAPIADYVMYAGESLSISNVASDPDLPINDLKFTLDSGFALAAAVDPRTGIFSVTSRETDLTSSNLLTLRVSDNGTPKLSSSRTFSLVILGRPVLDSLQYSNHVASLRWSSIPGQTYEVQYCDDLAMGTWAQLSADILATETFTTTTDESAPETARFYRVFVRH